ncbi:uncharacterized protein LOC131069894 [Cryptomeria japonica]|uniref:uncharacterized protein LOC131069894 n=1 Tax=Cryptomeria japonica TaxID=3369 RepID=UPI0027DA3E1E|nr:uncharacterized protein LOC131069894 [Cryptomeria japonica]
MGNHEVSFSKEEDEIIWCGSKNGCYLVKVGITLLERDAKVKEWESKICWNNACLLKVGAFAWLAGNKRILSGDRLKKMGFAGPFRCVLCEKAEEDVDHLLLNCEFAQKAWLFGLQRLNWMDPMAGKLCEWLESWPSLGKNSIFAAIWKILPSTVLCELWKERNQRVFDGRAENCQ